MRHAVERQLSHRFVIGLAAFRLIPRWRKARDEISRLAISHGRDSWSYWFIRKLHNFLADRKVERITRRSDQLGGKFEFDVCTKREAREIAVDVFD